MLTTGHIAAKTITLIYTSGNNSANKLLLSAKP